MYDLRLTYFDIPGGRAEPARLAMHIGGIKFEDIRFQFPQFAEVRKNTPLSQVPVLSVDGRQITQSNSITRFVGKLSGLYPEDNLQALLCDEVMDGVEDLTHKLVGTFGIEGEALKQAREAFVSGPLTKYLTWLGAKLEQSGGQYFADNKLTIADLKVFVIVRSFSSGNLDHIPVTSVETVAPKLSEHMKRIGQLPPISEYYQNS
jgi:glutathione S-transferase